LLRTFIPVSPYILMARSVALATAPIGSLPKAAEKETGAAAALGGGAALAGSGAGAGADAVAGGGAGEGDAASAVGAGAACCEEGSAAMPGRL
jgi:hypothetical protein